MDHEVIAKAKRYAQARNTSLSKLIEAYLDRLTSSQKSGDPTEVTPKVKGLSGVLSSSELKDYEESYHKHLKKKYGK